MPTANSRLVTSTPRLCQGEPITAVALPHEAITRSLLTHRSWTWTRTRTRIRSASALVSDAIIEATKAKVRAWLQPGQPGEQVFADNRIQVCILDGFLLYTPQMEGIMSQLDVKMFLLVSRAKATQRREARDGYVTLEGFGRTPGLC